jgi:NAD(P)-dependent dehydrogenase (short-subunit alcohol dehydrogenase family)
VVSGGAFRGDVSNLADLDRLYAKVKEQNDRIDILFANTGLGEIAPLEAITETHFDKTFSVNVKGLLFTVQKALPLFRNGGSIILNASIAASKAADGYSVYGASKAAVRSFARSWALELRHRKIRVNAVSPGPIDTPGHRGFVSGLAQDEEQVQQIRKSIESNVPLGRLKSPNEVASVVSLVASDDSGFITGIELFVDRGMA